MKEFGSDFHFIDIDKFAYRQQVDLHANVYLLVDGRQCIVALIRQYQWRRIWIPEYFCYETIDYILRLTGIRIAFYKDKPGIEETVESLPFKGGDVFFRINYFGTRVPRSNINIPVPVIEDHTHDLRSNWALHSDADWCIASLRKSLPLPEGGMMWSPKGHSISLALRPETEDHQKMVDTRWLAMQIKRDYLNGSTSNKEIFRKMFVETEKWFDVAELSLIDKRCREYICQFDINQWLEVKKRNWKLLCSLLSNEIQFLKPEDDSCTMFSLVLLAKSQGQREMIRHRLIEHAVYPAILWQVPEVANEEVQDFSHRMLSIHCDGRYTEDDIRHLAEIVNHIIES